MKHKKMATPEKSAEWYMAYTESGESHSHNENLGQFADRMDSLGYRCVKDWISVKDRLPESETEVLLYGDIEIETNAGQYDRVFKIFTGSYVGGFMEYITNEGTVYSVTHWMPLPEKPTP